MNSGRQPKNWEGSSPSDRVRIQHHSVMLDEVMHYLAPERKNGVFIDCTLGEGGHSEEILKTFKRIRLVGIDADRRIMEKARVRLHRFANRTEFFHRYFDEFFRDYPLGKPAHRILFDLGISLFHYTESGRGFSFLRDENLDMRINADQGLPLSKLLKDISEQELVKLLFEFGEERYARRIAAGIVRRRRDEEITSSLQLADIIESSVPAAYRRGRIHAATRSFQALRIYINAELERLKPALLHAFEHAEIGGRMGVISFHSLEDRVVKHVFKDLSKSCICPPNLPMCECGGKPLAFLPVSGAIQATADEVKHNPPSRSAKFRVIEKLRESRHGE